MIWLLFLSLANAGEGDFIVNIMEGELKDNPSRFAEWCESPEVIICKDSGLDSGTVEDTYQFLEQDISKVSMGTCECKVRPGKIQFGVQCFEREAHLGTTLINFNIPTGCMIGSVVQIKKDDTLVLTHEAAHSIGWMHSSLLNHLMFPVYKYVGWNTFGM